MARVFQSNIGDTIFAIRERQYRGDTVTISLVGPGKRSYVHVAAESPDGKETMLATLSGPKTLRAFAKAILKAIPDREGASE